MLANLGYGRAMAKSGIYGGSDPRELPAYPLIEVSHFLWLARAKANRWAFGYEHTTGKHSPVIRVADPAARVLSFNNLAELHVLSALRHHRVPLQRVRAAIRYLRQNVVGDHPHPLLAVDLHTDGLSIFVEYLGQYINITKYGQGVLRQMFEAHLQRIERDPNQHVVRLYPFVRPPNGVSATSVGDVAQQPKAVAIDPFVSFGRPVVAGTGIPTVELANRFSAGEPIESLATDMNLAPETIEEAIRYQLATRAA